MAKRKSKFKVSFSYDAPVTITFSLLCLLVFFLDSQILKGFLNQTIISSPTKTGDFSFSLNSTLSYFRLICYVFNSTDWTSLIVNLILLKFLGPIIEEKYGSIVIGIMIFVASIFSGVLGACFCENSLKGIASVIFMMFILNGLTSISKKKIPISYLLSFVLFIIYEIISTKSNGIVEIIINFTGGLSGSLLAFLTSPKAKKERKVNKKIEEIDSESPRFTQKKNSDKNDDDSTLIGTLNF